MVWPTLRSRTAKEQNRTATISDSVKEDDSSILVAMKQENGKHAKREIRSSIHFDGHFPSKPGSAASPSVFFFYLFWKGVCPQCFDAVGWMAGSTSGL